MESRSNQTMFFEELIFLDKAFQNTDQFFDFMFPILKNGGYVQDSFLSAIKKRENDYPTALPTEPYVVAIPHTDIAHIVKPFIAFTRLEGTTPWCEMASNDNVLQASFVFMLGFIEKDGHLNLLQALMSHCSNPDFLKTLRQVKSTQEALTLLTSNIQF